MGTGTREGELFQAGGEASAKTLKQRRTWLFQRGEKGPLLLTGREQEGSVVETEVGRQDGPYQVASLLTVSQRWS